MISKGWVFKSVSQDQKYYPELNHTNNFKETGNHGKREGWQSLEQPAPLPRSLCGCISTCFGLDLICEL